MPQELRNPEYRTDEAMEEVEKTFMIDLKLNNPVLKSYGVSFEFIVESEWPNINHLEADMLLKGLVYLKSPMPVEVN